MVTVVRAGKLPQDRTYRAECNHCHALLEFKRSEVQSVSSHRNEDYWSLDCPSCDKTASIDASLAKEVPEPKTSQQ